MAISSSRLRSCGRGFGGRAGTHRSEHVQCELRARSLVQTCASKAERVRGSVRDTVHEEAMLASSTVDERRSSSKTKVALPLPEIVWRSTPAAAQNHAHLGEIWLRRRRSQTSRAAPHTNQSSSYRAKRGFSKILPSRTEATSILAWVLQLRHHAQRLPRLTRPRRVDCAWDANAILAAWGPTLEWSS